MSAPHRFAVRGSAGEFAIDAVAEWQSGDTALFGASGSGKTTMLEALAGLRPEIAGEVVLAGARIDSLPPRHRRIGWVPQDAALFPHLTVRENLDFAVAARGDETAAARAIDALELGGLLERPASRLSGGERQRVAIARALASAPRFLLLDEPLAAIDRPLRARIVPFLERLRNDLAIPYLFVSHDPLEVVALASHVLVVEGGRIVATGAPRDVFAAAGSFGLLAALGAENVFDVTLLRRDEGTARVATRLGIELELALPAGFAPPCRVALRAEDILLAVARPEGLSAQNVLAGEVRALDRSAARGTLLIEIAVRTSSGEGETFRARITAAAAERLALRPGAAAWIVIKAHAIHPV
jgi:molybdate transport system ATP-binding protein